MGSADAVINAYAPLTEDFTVYVFDRRKDLPEVYSMEEMARDTEEAIKALGINHVDIFGASQGGIIAMEIAANNPKLVDTLVLGSTTSEVTEEQFQLFDNWIKVASEGKMVE